MIRTFISHHLIPDSALDRALTPEDEQSPVLAQSADRPIAGGQQSRCGVPASRRQRQSYDLSAVVVLADDGDWRRGVVEHLLADRAQVQTADAAGSTGSNDHKTGGS